MPVFPYRYTQIDVPPRRGQNRFTKNFVVSGTGTGTGSLPGLEHRCGVGQAPEMIPGIVLLHFTT
jgi:hypothetical protein